MLESLITSKTRIKLLLKFFLNSNTESYLRNLESEFGENSNAIRLELNRLENANLLSSSYEGNKKFYKANTKHPLFKDIRNIVFKHTGIDLVIDRVVSQLGNLKEAYITGDFAIGRESDIIDLLLIGDGINRDYLVSLTKKVEEIIKHRIRFIIGNDSEKNLLLKNLAPALLIWEISNKNQAKEE